MEPIRLLCPWGFPGKNIGVGCYFLLQGIFLTQGSSLCILHCRGILYHWANEEAPVRVILGQIFLSLKMDQGMQEPSKSWEGQENWFSPTAAQREAAQWDPWHTSDCQNCEIISLCCFKPLNLCNLLQQRNEANMEDLGVHVCVC